MLMRYLMFDPSLGDVCRVADGVTMLVNATERGEVSPEVREGVKRLVSGMLGGTLDEARGKALCFVTELCRCGASSVSPDFDCSCGRGCRSSYIESLTSDKAS